MSLLESEFPPQPFAPEAIKVLSESKTLRSMRDELSHCNLDSRIEETITRLIERGAENPDGVNPYSEIQALLDEVRNVPVSAHRVRLMNSIVRTLGRRSNLATFLDLLRKATLRSGSHEQSLCKDKLQLVKM